MPIVLTKKRIASALKPGLVTSKHAADIDVVGAEAASLAVLEKQIKDLATKAKPMQARRKKLLEDLTKEAEDNGEKPDAEGLVMRGEKYQVELGKQSSSRIISDMEALIQEMGTDNFLKVATVTLTNVDQYVSKNDQQAFVDTVRGNREGKLTKRPE